MKDELKYKDIDSNTMDGVRNVNELGKSIIILLVHVLFVRQFYFIKEKE